MHSIPHTVCFVHLSTLRTHCETHPIVLGTADVEGIRLVCAWAVAPDQCQSMASVSVLRPMLQLARHAAVPDLPAPGALPALPWLQADSALSAGPSNPTARANWRRSGRRPAIWQPHPEAAAEANLRMVAAPKKSQLAHPIWNSHWRSGNTVGPRHRLRGMDDQKQLLVRERGQQLKPQACNQFPSVLPPWHGGNATEDHHSALVIAFALVHMPWMLAATQHHRAIDTVTHVVVRERVRPSKWSVDSFWML